MKEKEAREIIRKYEESAGPATMDRNCGYAEGYLEAIKKMKVLKDAMEALVNTINLLGPLMRKVMNDSQIGPLVAVREELSEALAKWKKKR